MFYLINVNKIFTQDVLFLAEEFICRKGCEWLTSWQDIWSKRPSISQRHSLDTKVMFVLSLTNGFEHVGCYRRQ